MAATLEETLKQLENQLLTLDGVADAAERIDAIVKGAQIKILTKKISNLPLVGRVYFDTERRIHGVNGVGIIKTDVPFLIGFTPSMMFILRKDDVKDPYYSLLKAIPSWGKHAEKMCELSTCVTQKMIKEAKDRSGVHGEYPCKWVIVPVYVYYKMPTFADFEEGCVYKGVEVSNSGYISTAKKYARKGDTIYRFRLEKTEKHPQRYEYVKPFPKDYISSLMLLSKKPLPDDKEIINKRQRIE